MPVEFECTVCNTPKHFALDDWLTHQTTETACGRCGKKTVHKNLQYGQLPRGVQTTAASKDAMDTMLRAAAEMAREERRHVSELETMRSTPPPGPRGRIAREFLDGLTLEDWEAHGPLRKVAANSACLRLAYQTLEAKLMSQQLLVSYSRASV
eukprot:gene3588-4029_t